MKSSGQDVVHCLSMHKKKPLVKGQFYLANLIADRTILSYLRANSNIQMGLCKTSMHFLFPPLLWVILQSIPEMTKKEDCDAQIINIPRCELTFSCGRKDS